MKGARFPSACFGCTMTAVLTHVLMPPTPTRGRRFITDVILVCLVVSAVLLALLLSGASSDVPSPFGGQSPLRGQVTDIGTKGGHAVKTVTFDAGEISEPLSANDLHVVLLPGASDISAGATLSSALTSGKRVYGYKYASRDAAAEKAAAARAAGGEPLSFTDLFPGEFFASDTERASGAFVGAFEQQKGVIFKNLSDVTLSQNARYIILAVDDGVRLHVRGLPVGPACSNAVDDDMDEASDYAPQPVVLRIVTGATLQSLAYGADGTAYVLTQGQSVTNTYDRPASLWIRTATGAEQTRPFPTVNGQYVSIAHHLTVGHKYLAFALMNWSYVDTLFIVDKTTLQTLWTVPMGTDDIYGLWFDEQDPRWLYVLGTPNPASDVGHRLSRFDVEAFYRPGEYPVGNGNGIVVPSIQTAFDDVRNIFYFITLSGDSSIIRHVNPESGLVRSVLLQSDVRIMRLLSADNEKVRYQSRRGIGTFDAATGYAVGHTYLERFIGIRGFAAARSSDGVLTGSANGKLRIVRTDLTTGAYRVQETEAPVATDDLVSIAHAHGVPGAIVGARTTAGHWMVVAVPPADVDCHSPLGTSETQSSDPICGNGVLEQDEDCDGDAACIQASCRRAQCGDGVQEAPEECDDANGAEHDGCTYACLAERCEGDSEASPDPFVAGTLTLRIGAADPVVMTDACRDSFNVYEYSCTEAGLLKTDTVNCDGATPYCLRGACSASPS